MKGFIDLLVVENFKSYGEGKVEIPLGKGFIAVVGPNGAGKSNIGDAISFALGLATARTLRAKNLSHLIFSKDGKRADYAYVEVHFKNYGAFPTHEEDVVISRKVYKDGRSVFRINGVQVRESELAEFLSKAGLYETAYNIVLQGDVVRFLKMTPVERRKLIEEIAGIGEFEEKKQKALENLGQVELKIRELRLLIDEVELQMEKLSEELKRLEAYRELEHKRKVLQAKLYQKELTTLEDRIKELFSQKQAIHDQLEQLKGTIRQLEEKLKEKEELLENTNRELLPYREKVGKLSSDLEHAEEKIKELNRRSLELNQEVVSATERERIFQRTLEELEFQINTLQESITVKEEELRELEEEAQKIKVELSQKEDVLRVSLEEAHRAEEKLGQMNKDLKEKKNRLSYIQLKVKELEMKIQKVMEDIQRLSDEANSIQSQKEELLLSLENYRKMLEEENISLSKKRMELKEAEERLNEMRKAREELLKKMAVLEDTLSRISPESLPFEGIEGVYGRVSDLISVKDPQHIKAIEVAGGGRLSFVVVEDEEVARKCIQRLKELKLGRMSFIPLNKVREQPLPPYPRVRGALDFVVKLVDYDPKFKKVVSFVFGDTLLVEDFEAAKRIGIGTYRMVTLDGELFEKSGVISGGSYEVRGELGREVYIRELEDLKKQEEKLLESLKKEEERVKRLREELVEKEGVLHILQRRIKEIEEKEKKDLDRLKDIENRIIKAQEYITITQEEIKKLQEEEKKLVEEINYLEKKIENISIKRQSILSHYKELGIEELRRQYEAVESKLKLKREELYKLQVELKEKEAQKESVFKEMARVKALFQRVEEEQKEISQKLAYLTSHKERLQEELKKLNEEAYKLYKLRDELEKEIKDLQIELGRLRLQEEEKSTYLNSILVELAKLEERTKELKEKLASLGVEQTLQVGESINSLRQELAAVEKRLERFGNVNFMAEEDYKQALDKHKELTERYNKAKEEKKAITELIQEVESKKLKAFMSAFRAINANLKRVFAYLSPGGRINMELEREDDPFSGGIHVHIKPRGKDVQYMEAMSGGEKTLAALSLIFAIQEYKPSVFYYFDEVDAHLDEANAVRVAQLIKEKSKEQQFIVVTLREAMAEFADKLIGVSARGGISRVFPLQNITQNAR
ncbi:chromosome segregation protein SMC [Thermocrinis minervae]|uniref:Chromosome partition protein Smc n=1 Tax=Thermocrinis minervae TaxID=381751 RepID=A0A1M6S4J7_9AQUI|nr:chromosome segregation protein SMC [Thermocrinis minervae]SHK39438.1 condensin subunit Smc [Thermocrinis minervae]